MPLPSVKVIIAEQGGVELNDPTEYDLTAANVPFSAAGFASDNVKDAVIEAATGDIALVNLIPYIFTVSGNASDKWAGFNDSSSPSNDVPWVASNDGDLFGLLITNGKDNVDIDVEVYKNAALVYTWEVRNTRTAFKISASSLAAFSQGDRVSVFLRKYTEGTGDPVANSPKIYLMLKLQNLNSGDGGTQTGD